MKPAFPKIGCCGFPLSKTKYASQFSVGEVQHTFYQPPQISTLQRWRASVPEDFEFTLKAWQLITHSCTSPTYRRMKHTLSTRQLLLCGGFKTNSQVKKAWNTTRACAEALGARQVLFQCPASFIPSPQNIRRMEKFFSSVDRRQLRFLWEPRGEWPRSLLKSLCRQLELVHVVDPFLGKTVTKDFIYFRLHGGKGFRHVFSDDELRALLAMLKFDGRPEYVMFNNMAMLPQAGKFAEMAASHGRSNLNI